MKALDPRLEVKEIRISKVTTSSCYLHFTMIGLADTVNARLMKEKGVMVVTVWDTNGKVREHFIAVLEGRTIATELGGCLLLALTQRVQKPTEKKPQGLIDPILPVGTVLGDNSRLAINFQLAGATKEGDSVGATP